MWCSNQQLITDIDRQCKGIYITKIAPLKTPVQRVESNFSLSSEPTEDTTKPLKMPVQRLGSTTPLVPNPQGYSGDGLAAGDIRHDSDMGAFGGARPKSRTPTVEQDTTPVSGEAIEEILLKEKEQAKTFPSAMDHSKLTLSVQKVDRSVQTSPEPEDTGNFNVRPSVPSVNQGTTSSAEDKPPATEYESRFENDFNVHDVIGKGGFGCVFSVTNKLDKHPYAVKRMKIKLKQSDLELALREVQILACLQHENVVRYYTTWTENPPDEWQKRWDRNHGCTGDSSSGNEESSSTYNENQSQSNNNANSNNNNATGINNNLPVTVAKATFSDVARPSLTDGMFNNQIGFRFGSTEKLNSASAEANQSHVNSGRHNRPIYDPQNNVNNNCPDTLVCSKPRTPKVHLYIKMELCGKETLKDWLVNNKDRPKDQILMFLHRITAGLKYIHGKKIIHRDLKPDNIFFTSAPNSQVLIPKIGDFGLSKYVGKVEDDCEDNLRHTSQVGTGFYRSPELKAGKKYCYKTDVFSLGVMVAEMLMPFETECERSLVLTGMLTHFPKDLKNNHKTESELIKRMISENVDERPSAEELHGHKIFCEQTCLLLRIVRIFYGFW